MQTSEQHDLGEPPHWIGELEENLERLTLDIPEADIDDLPTRYQRSIVGVSGRFSRLLRRVAQAVMCYHKHH